MGRYTGPKARINRRLGAQIFESAGAVRAHERRDHPPGMRTRVRRPSNYGLALMEKQKIKYYYGLGEKQLRIYFDKAGRQKGNTGENLLLLCERRLDNIVRRAGYTKTRPPGTAGHCARALSSERREDHLSLFPSARWRRSHGSSSNESPKYVPLHHGRDTSRIDGMVGGRPGILPGDSARATWSQRCEFAGRRKYRRRILVAIMTSDSDADRGK